MALWDVSNRDVLSFQLKGEKVTEQESFDMVTQLKAESKKSLLLLEIPYAREITDNAVVIIKSFLKEFHENKVKCVIMAAPQLVERFSQSSFSTFVSLIEHEPIVQNQNLEKHKKISVLLTATMVEGLMQTIESMTSLAISNASILEKSQITFSNVSVGSSIGFTSQETEGSQVKMGEVILQIPQKTFLNIVNKITGIQYDEINDENRDWACELMNMCSVLAREFLNRKSVTVNLTLPTLLTAESLKHKFSQKLDNVTSTTLMYDGHPFFLITRVF